MKTSENRTIAIVKSNLCSPDLYTRVKGIIEKMGFTPTFAESSGSNYSNQYIIDAVGVIAIGYHSDDNFEKMRFVGKGSYSEINLAMQQGKPIIYTDQGKFYHINALVEHNPKDWTKEYGAVHLGNHISF